MRVNGPVADREAQRAAPSPTDPGAGPRPPQATVLGLLRRQWIAAVPVLVITLLVVLALEAGKQVDYRASSALLLASPEVDPGRFPDVETVLRTISGRLDGTEMREELGLEAGDFRAIPVDERTLEVFVIGSTASEARERLRAASRWIEEDLAAMQAAAGYAAPDRISMRMIAPEPVPVADLAGAFEVNAIIRLEGAGIVDANPYRASDDTLRLLQVAASSDSSRQRLASQVGEQVDVQVWAEPRDLAPVIHVTAYGVDAEETLSAVQAGRRLLESEIEARQDRAQVPRGARVWLDPLSHPVDAERLTPWLSGSSLMTLSAGLVLAVGACAALDWHGRRRRDPGRTSRSADPQ